MIRALLLTALLLPACGDETTMQQVFGSFCTWEDGAGWVENCAD